MPRNFIVYPPCPKTEKTYVLLSHTGFVRNIATYYTICCFYIPGISRRQTKKPTLRILYLTSQLVYHYTQPFFLLCIQSQFSTIFKHCTHYTHSKPCSILGCENLYQDRFFFIFQHFNAIHTFFYFVCKKIDSSPSLIFLFLHNIP